MTNIFKMLTNNILLIELRLTGIKYSRDKDVRKLRICDLKL